MGLAHQGIQGRGEAERDAESEVVPAELGGRKIRDSQVFVPFEHTLW